MNKQALINRAGSAWFYPVTDKTQTYIEFTCSTCKMPMPVFQRYRFDKKRLLACLCGYRCFVNEEEYEALTGLCFTCSKEGCCANDHRFIGVIPAGMGL